jgi:hypothetical protein
MKRLLVALCLILPAAALAQTPPYVYPRIVGTASVQVLPGPNNARRRIVFQNPNATALVAVCPALSRVNSAPITCAINGAGSITLLPYASFPVDGVGQNGAIPSPWNAISDTAGAHLTILEFE